MVLDLVFYCHLRRFQRLERSLFIGANSGRVVGVCVCVCLFCFIFHSSENRQNLHVLYFWRPIIITLAFEEERKSAYCLPPGKQESLSFQKVFPFRQLSAHKLRSCLCTYQLRTGSP